MFQCTVILDYCNVTVRSLMCNKLSYFQNFKLVTHFVDPRCQNVPVILPEVEPKGLKHVGLGTVLIKYLFNNI